MSNLLTLSGSWRTSSEKLNPVTKMPIIDFASCGYAVHTWTSSLHQNSWTPLLVFYTRQKFFAPVPHNGLHLSLAELTIDFLRHPRIHDLVPCPRSSSRNPPKPTV